MAEFTEEMLATDCERIFADWGRPAVYRRVTQVFSPETMQIVETYSDREITAVFRAEEGKPAPDAGGQQVRRERVLLFRIGDVPESPVSLTSRIVAEGVTYQITGWDRAADGQVVLVRGRRA